MFTTRKNKVRIFWVAVTALLFNIGAVTAQTYKLNNSKSTLTVFGTSNVHDWEMVSEKQTGELVVKSDLTPEKLVVEFEAEGLKSGKSGMDKNAYKALNTDKHKKISFQCSDIKSNVDKGNGVKALELNGNLTINGVTKKITVPLTLKKSGSSIEVSGEKGIKMTEYKVDPPKALMGTIKTGEELTIKFKINFSE